MNEFETRAEHIDPPLKTAGWGVVDGSMVRREYRTPRAWRRPSAMRASWRFATAMPPPQVIYGIDMATDKEGHVAAWPGPDALWALTFAEKNARRDRFAAVPFSTKNGT